MRPHWRYRAERLLFRVLLRIFVRRGLDVQGLDNIPAKGAAIVVGNHIATVDPPMVGAQLVRTDVFYMAKAEAFRTAVARFFLRGWNAFPVVRQTADRRAIAVAMRCLEQGSVVVMFPEGSRAHDTALHRAFPGVGFLALRSGAPVVCAGVIGTENVLPKGAFWPRNAEVTLRFGTPFTIPRHHEDGRRVTNQQAADVIMAHLADLLPERYRGVYEPEGDGQRRQGGTSGGDTGGHNAPSATPASAA